MFVLYNVSSLPACLPSFDKENNVRLEEQIKLQHLQQLQNEFDRHKPQDIRVQQGNCRPDKIEKRTPGCMNLQEFQDTVAKVLGTYEYTEYLEKLFTKVGKDGRDDGRHI